MNLYDDFLNRKTVTDVPTGFKPTMQLNPMLFDWQRDIVTWALRRGRAAIWADCGLGKTPMQLEWSSHVAAHTRGRVLIAAPLAVAKQTVREGAKFGIPVTYARKQDEAAGDIVITNYEMLEHFDVSDTSDWAGVVLDESSILKNYTGKIRNHIIESFARTPYRLACTATPAPNDYMELGNHAEFIGSMSRTEMLAMFFVHDGGDTSSWRIKGHAKEAFWRWLATWAVMVRTPSDIGYSDEGFKLPALTVDPVILKAVGVQSETLFPMEVVTLSDQRAARRSGLGKRVESAAKLINETPGPWVVWCDLNDESAALTKAIPGAVEVKGSDDAEDKESALEGFAAGKYRVIVSKASIAGFGLNWQHCANMAFVGLSHSWESYYQAIRRCWRFGQKKPVGVKVFMTDVEMPILRNIQRKEREAQEMLISLSREMAQFSKKEIKGQERQKMSYETAVKTGKGWEVRLGDCVEEVAKLKDGSVGFSVFSPPFASLYTYTNSDRDMGNCKNHGEFMKHFRYLIVELHRVTAAGRNVSFHCMNLPTSKERDGFIGIRDFRGMLIKEFEDAGFIFHSEVCIWKDPVTAMQRTKAIGLLHKQLIKDRTLSRQGIPDYLVTMRKPGVNAKLIAGALDEYVGDDKTLTMARGKWNRDEMRDSINIWQRYASPVWMDINPSDTLQYRSARENEDERHICPLQLEVIKRAAILWSAPGDLVLDPFAGIGSTGDVVLRMDRQFIGVELKRSYWDQAWKNCEAAAKEVDADMLVVASR